MRINELRKKLAKSVPAEKAESIRLIAGFGIEGDAGAGKPTRQVSLLSMEAGAARARDGLCSPKFSPNLEIDGMEASELRVGERLRMADAVIEIERIGKDCYPECEALQREGPCVLARESVFARVLESGDVRTGQAVEKV
ncbi:MAG TPA: MOSC domain-containing protein [Treponema sp.]|nr:MOSC domain-containing protein [Treponema sp.]